MATTCEKFRMFSKSVHLYLHSLLVGASFGGICHLKWKFLSLSMDEGALHHCID